MMIEDVVMSAMGEWPRVFEQDGEIIVPTHCLYPSNGSVTVSVCPAIGGHYLVTDRGGAYDEVGSSGSRLAPFVAARMIKHLASGYGLTVDGNCLIRADRVKPDELMSAIILVANASKDAASDMLHRFKPRLRRNLKAELAELLEVQFPHHVLRNKVVVVGASNKPHRFDSAVRLSGDRQLVLDVVSREASSINAALVAHLDIKNANLARIEQRIIYDDDDKWSSADLNLLKIGAIPVPFSKAASVLERLAA